MAQTEDDSQSWRAFTPVLLLLAICILINYIDRGNLSIAAGAQAAGPWTGLQNGFANLAGVAAPALTGFAVDRTGSFVAAMAITAGVLVVGGLAWVFVVGRVEQVGWTAKGDVLLAATTGPA
jgi:hypothetical protein